MSVTGVNEVRNKITDIFSIRRAQLLLLCSYYAEKAKQEFDRRQPSGQNASGDFWTSRTGQAALRVQGYSGNDGTTAIFWALAHGVQYGIYLELANDRRYASLNAIVMQLLPQFKEDLKQIYGE